jgi:hypothetical protein
MKGSFDIASWLNKYCSRDHTKEETSVAQNEGG